MTNGTGQADAESQGIDSSPPVPDDTLLYRRVNKVHYKRMSDGSFRLRDGAFKNWPETKDMSVVLDDKLRELGRTPEDVRAGYPPTLGSRLYALGSSYRKSRL